MLLLDSAPVIYYFENHPKFADHYEPLFSAQTAGALRFAVTPITIAEVLTGPLRLGNDATARRYLAILRSWEFVGLTIDIAERAARLRASLPLKLPDAIQVASALAIDAAALVTADRELSKLRSLRVIS
ncbi:MAG: type II toxin-antitoxin system VapC family toxin [Stellaceae bacterium]